MELPGEKLLIKMWETIAEKGIGSLLTPWQEKRVAKARLEIRREELLILAQAEKEAESIRAGESVFSIDSRLKLIDPKSNRSNELEEIQPRIEFSDLAKRAACIEVSESIRKEINIAKAVMVTEDILAQDPHEPSEENVGEDWLFSWREYAGRVSTEELQILWGKILAGEVKQPGTYSFRTLEFLKGLSKAEAEIISIAASFVIADRIYRKKEEFLNKAGLNFAELLYLQDIGILSGVDALGLSTTYKSVIQDKFLQPLSASNKIIILEHEDRSKEVKAEIYLLTRVGAEVLRLASFQVNQDYLESVAKDYAAKGFTVKVADWIQETPTSGRFYNPKEIKADEIIK